MFFKRSNTMVDSSPKPHHLNPSLSRTTSITTFYTSVESLGSSLKGKFNNFCRLFESSKPASPNPPPPTKQKSLFSESRISPFPSLNNSVIRLPGTEDRIVVYLTSLGGIRRTYEDCYAVKMLFSGFCVSIDYRDVFVNIAYREELQVAMGEKNVSLPQVFIKGKYVGGADVIKSLFGIGELAKILEEFPRRKPGFECQCCGEVRFILCPNCSGSKKLFDEDEDRFKGCPDCNENGLIFCPHCSPWISPFPSLSNSVISLPGTEDRIVVYLTSLRGIRRTYEDCYNVKMMFSGFCVWIDYRDVSMNIAYRKELQMAMCEKKNVSLPQVFIKGKYAGGADVIKSLFEIGELAKIVEEFPRRKPGFECKCCGEIRFILCPNCSGSKKLFDEDRVKRCPDCNENGLVRCPYCSP